MSLPLKHMKALLKDDDTVGYSQRCLVCHAETTQTREAISKVD